MVECPKCHGPAFRVYSQTTSEKTGRSTTVTHAYVFCGELGTRKLSGREVGAVLSSKHGFVRVPNFEVARRQAIAKTSKAHPEWAIGKGRRKPKAAAKTPVKGRKTGRARPQTRPKGSGRPRTRPRASTGSAAAPPKRPVITGETPAPTAEFQLTPAGKAVAEKLPTPRSG